MLEGLVEVVIETEEEPFPGLSVDGGGDCHPRREAMHRFIGETRRCSGRGRFRGYVVLNLEGNVEAGPGDKRGNGC